MKKYSFIILSALILAMLTLSACDETINLNKKKERVRLLYSNTDHTKSDAGTITITEDMDGDGRTEDISINCSGDPYEIDITIGDQAVYNVVGELYAYNIPAIYLTDIDSKDNAKEIVLYTVVESDDPLLQIFRYQNGEIKKLSFEIQNYDGTKDETDNFFVGYIKDFPFEVIKNNRIRIHTQTQSRGMWDVSSEYQITDGQTFRRVKQTAYDIVQGTEYCTDEDGYAEIKSELKIDDDNIIIPGEYIRIIDDDFNDNVTLENRSGKKYKFNLNSYEIGELFDICELFYLAG